MAFTASLGALPASVSGKSAAELPPRRAALLALRILAFDQNLDARAPGNATIGVVVPRSGAADPQCAAMLSELNGHSQTMTVAGLRSAAVKVRVDDLAERAGELTALYVCSGLESSLQRIGEIARRERLLTFGHSANLVGRGVSIAFVVRGNRPRILLDVKTARTEGVDFDSALLRVAEIVR